MTLILASSSPRRQELLKWITTDFEVIVSDVDETITKKLLPEEYVAELAQRKANAIQKKHPDDWVIGVDTVVSLDEFILGKPKNRLEAEKTLNLLSGRSHFAFTGVSIITPHRTKCFVCQTEITFYPLSDSEINRYLDTGDYQDKAGSYGIQSGAALFVKEIKGDYYTVMGLPVGALNQALKELNEPLK